MPKLLVIDTETGGIDPDRHSLLSVAAVVWNDGAIGAEFEVLVGEPELAVTAKALEINRIDLVAHAERALSPADSFRTFVQFLEEQFGSELERGEKIVLAGHNVAFDIGFLKRLCRLASEPFDARFSHRSLDTASVLRFLSLSGILPPTAIDSSGAFAYLKVAIPAAERHTALGDARATATMLSRLVQLTHNAALLAAE